jgi:hypothetical protein
VVRVAAHVVTPALVEPHPTVPGVVCYARRGARIPDDVTGFVKHSFSSNPRPRLAVVTDCVLVVGLIVGHPLHEADLLVLEKT